MPPGPLAAEILDFWFPPGTGAERDVWFRKDDAFDRDVRERFGAALAAGLAGAFGEWCTTPRAFAGDARALATSEYALEREFDRALDPHARWFLYMPFEHSEDLAMQDRGIALFTALAAETGVDAPLPWAHRHRDVVRRFGRFPHRNDILGRASTAEEIAFLAQPGSRF